VLTPLNPRSRDQKMLHMMRAVAVPSLLALVVLAAMAACGPTPEGNAPVKAGQQMPANTDCGGDQGMATQFYHDLNGTRSGPAPTSNCQ
jgi:hypothetical protein